MKAELLLHRKTTLPDGAVVEMKLWLVPSPVEPSGHLYKYSLFYGYEGKRIVAYDNERGKGDHIHYGEAEVAYTFSTPEMLIADFLADVQKARRD